jgi:hypothetical protein
VKSRVLEKKIQKEFTVKIRIQKDLLEWLAKKPNGLHVGQFLIIASHISKIAHTTQMGMAFDPTVDEFELIFTEKSHWNQVRTSLQKLKEECLQRSEWTIL